MKHKDPTLDYQEKGKGEWTLTEQPRISKEDNITKLRYEKIFTKTYLKYNIYINILQEDEGYSITGILWHKERNVLKNLAEYVLKSKKNSLDEAFEKAIEYTTKLEECVDMLSLTD